MPVEGAVVLFVFSLPEIGGGVVNRCMKTSQLARGFVENERPMFCITSSQFQDCFLQAYSSIEIAWVWASGCAGD